MGFVARHLSMLPGPSTKPSRPGTRPPAYTNHCPHRLAASMMDAMSIKEEPDSQPIDSRLRSPILGGTRSFAEPTG
ncbi:hypothetical protein SUGI_1491980 [Cryptomeria japonica]|uniref:Uncharacterized protein n=1 Tax=Cryptomeria japonica TaxID=3369 RepID=A0AAD3RQR1_CRYJA|nr:hypothetical protein SUGI_1446920 [Cryptomeria japonica]GLJ59083.1 hypothetical protein SUGI_1491980 [Cryptomeria japonica]